MIEVAGRGGGPRAGLPRNPGADARAARAEPRTGGRRPHGGPLRELRRHLVFVGPLTSSACPYCASAPSARERAHVPNTHLRRRRAAVPRSARNGAGQPEGVGELAVVRAQRFCSRASRASSGRVSSVLDLRHAHSVTVSGQRGEHYWVTVGSGKDQRRERRTRWYPASGSFQRFFDDVLVLAAKASRTTLMLESRTLAAWASVTRSSRSTWPAISPAPTRLSWKTALNDAKVRIDAAIYAKLRPRIGGDEQRIHSMTSRYGAITFKHLLLPAWLMAYRYRGQGVSGDDQRRHGRGPGRTAL